MSAACALRAPQGTRVRPPGLAYGAARACALVAPTAQAATQARQAGSYLRLTRLGAATEEGAGIVIPSPALAPAALLRASPPRGCPARGVLRCAHVRSILDHPVKNSRQQKMRSDGNYFPSGRKVLTQGFKEAAAGGPK